MRSALRLLAPAAAASRATLPRAFAAASLSSPSRYFGSAAHAGAAFDAAVRELPYADFLRVPDSDVLLDARHTKWQVDACVRGLREYGVTPGSNVALLLVPSTEFTLLQLAAIKLGATVVCIDPCSSAAVIAQVLSKHSIAALFVSLDAPTSGASAAETLKSLLPELQAKRITEGKVVKYKSFPSLKFVAHTGDETQPHGVLRVRDIMWGESVGDKGVAASSPPNAQAPCLVFVDANGAVTGSIGHDSVSSAIAAWLKRTDTAADSKTFGPHGVAGDSGSFFKAFYGGK